MSVTARCNGCRVALWRGVRALQRAYHHFFFCLLSSSVVTSSLLHHFITSSSLHHFFITSSSLLHHFFITSSSLLLLPSSVVADRALFFRFPCSHAHACRATPPGSARAGAASRSYKPTPWSEAKSYGVKRTSEARRQPWTASRLSVAARRAPRAACSVREQGAV